MRQNGERVGDRPAALIKGRLQASEAMAAGKPAPSKPPLRVPAGAPAVRILAARREAPDTEPFLPADIDW